MARVPHPESDEAVAQRLTIIRLAYSAALGLEEPISQREMARRLGNGMTEQKWTNYIQCRNRLPIDVAIRLHRLTGADLGYIYEGIERGLSGVMAAEISKLQRRERPARRA